MQQESTPSQTETGRGERDQTGEGQKSQEQQKRSQETRARQDQEKKHRVGETEKHKKASREAEKAKKPQLQERREPQKVKIKFEDAEALASDVNAIQNEAGVVLDKTRVEGRKKFLIKSGYDSFRNSPVAKPVAAMNAAEVVVAMQHLLRNSQKTEPQVPLEHLEYDKLAIVTKKEFVEKASSWQEEDLTVDKVNQYLHFEELGPILGPDRGGPGTMEAEPAGRRWSAQDLQDIKQTISGLTQLATTRLQLGEAEFNRRGLNTHWDELNASLNERIMQVQRYANDRHYKEVHEFAKIIEKAVELAEHPAIPTVPGEPTPLRALETFLPMARRTALIAIRDNLNKHFEGIYENMSEKARETVLGDLEIALQTAIDQLRIGLTLDDLKENFFGGFGRDRRTGEIVEIQGLIERGRVDEEINRVRGIREWRVTQEVDGVETKLGIELLTQPPARWQEVPQRLNNIYRFIESTDFTVEQLSASVQKAIQMIETVQRNNPEGRKVLAQLNKELKAFQAFHSYRVTMERAAMNPEEVRPVFKSYFEDRTWEYFVARFAKDSRGRDFVDAQGRNVNLFDIGEKLYFERLQKERLRMNLVEGLTVVGIERTLGHREFRAIEKLLGRLLEDSEKEELENLRGEFSRRVRNNTDMSEGDWGIDIDATRKVINAWHEQNNLLGAVEHLGDRRAEMREELFRRLDGFQVRGTDGNLRRVDLEELRESGFLDSVDYNAYYFVWTMAWSDYDVIRIYGLEAVGKKDPMIKDVAYNQSSFMWFGRNLDHTWEFFANEVRGRPHNERETNEIIRKAFPGKRHDLFARNRTMVRFFDYFTTKGQREDLGIEEKINDLMRKHDFGVNHPDPEVTKWFRSWAEGIVLAELIDDGKVSFAEKNFSEEPIDIAQYRMGDLFDDRGGTVKYLGRDSFQNYLINPTEGKFLDINYQLSQSTFYSSRVIRLWPWMTLALRAHWEFASKHKLRLFDDDNLVSAEGEKLVVGLISNGCMERKQGDKEKRKLFGFNEVGGKIWFTNKVVKIPLGEFFGILPLRRARQSVERGRRLGWDSKFVLFWAFLAGLGQGIVELAKQIPKQLAGGVAGR